MEQKELPQEVVNEIEKGEYPMSWAEEQEYSVPSAIIGAQIAQSHYEPIISTLKENVRLLAIEAQDVLSEKDTTIKDLNEHAQSLYETAKELAKVGVEYKNEAEAAKQTIKEQAEKIEKLTGLLKQEVTKKMFPVHAEPAWDDFKEQHGI